MSFLIFAGVVSFVAGIFFLFFPENLRKLNVSLGKALSKALNFDERLFRLRIGLGISLVLVSVMCFFVAYYIIRKYG